MSSLSTDLNAKKRVYHEAGALEYLVFDVPHQKFHWFGLQDGQFVTLEADPDGLYRSAAFPGLWLDADAFVREDGRALMASLRRGLESEAHTDFVDRLGQNRVNRPEPIDRLFGIGLRLRERWLMATLDDQESIESEKFQP